ncbi:adenylate/guanylate cyclase domain-containing protein [Rhizobium sp. SYY.PMSO]|uniref:adenylate/guanylate cyclase domain-containing protein n=1 Tax=Rhizobium sp. SYY.PMSO TaxID=3382192 RepID=UPI000DDD2489
METPPLQRKLAAILAADVEGYSRLMHLDEERTLAMLTSHRAIVDGLIENANGQIFGTAGDSILAEFPSVVQAFNCAIAIQLAIDRANVGIPMDEQMNFRIGINVGDVMVKSGDIFGDGVNIAARLESLADVGGICVTRGVRDHIRDRVEAKFQDMGEHTVKNIARPVRIFKVLFDASYEPVLARALPRSRPGEDVTLNTDEDLTEIAFWESIRDDDDGTELRLYLEHYPDGAFSDLARARLRHDLPPSEEPAVEVSFWESVRDSGNIEMIRAYIERYPAGKFVSLAQILLQKNSP